MGEGKATRLSQHRRVSQYVNTGMLISPIESVKVVDFQHLSLRILRLNQVVSVNLKLTRVEVFYCRFCTFLVAKKITIRNELLPRETLW